MNRTPITTALAAAVLLAVTTGCSVEKPAPVVDAADTPASVSSDAPATDTTAEAPSEAPEVSPTAAIGDTVSVGDWDVRVTDVALDADAAIMKANEFNESPAGRYVLVSYEATFTGSERIGDSFMDLTWSFTTSDAQVNDQSYVVTPADGSPTEARRGGTVALDVAFDLPPDLVTGGTLTVEAYDADFDLVYADFAI